MERPKPTHRLIEELCAGIGKQKFIESVHHGLYETPLTDFYSRLDLDETVAFAAGSWDARQRSSFSCSGSIYDIFSDAYRIGMPWLKTNKNISSEKRELYGRLNPFQGKDLRSRLSDVPPAAVENLKDRLQEKVNEYVFPCQYQERKRMRGGDNYKLEIMEFQNVYPKRGRIIPAFAAEIGRMVGEYPTEYRKGAEQVSLF